MNTQTKTNSLNDLIDPTFIEVKRLFGLSFVNKRKVYYTVY